MRQRTTCDDARFGRRFSIAECHCSWGSDVASERCGRSWESSNDRCALQSWRDVSRRSSHSRMSSLRISRRRLSVSGNSSYEPSRSRSIGNDDSSRSFGTQRSADMVRDCKTLCRCVVGSTRTQGLFERYLDRRFVLQCHRRSCCMWRFHQSVIARSCGCVCGWIAET